MGLEKQLLARVLACACQREPRFLMFNHKCLNGGQLGAAQSCPNP